MEKLRNLASNADSKKIDTRDNDSMAQASVISEDKLAEGILESLKGVSEDVDGNHHGVRLSVLSRGQQ